jgi:putative ABC transport system permease protein
MRPALRAAYGLSLRLLPRSFRRRHGEAMASLVRELAAEAGVRGAASEARVWTVALLDVVRRAAVEHRRARRASVPRRRSVSMLGPDLRFALRSIRRQPYVSALVVGMLALGIAANTAVFSLLNGLFLRPFPFRDSDRLVYLNETAPRWDLEYTGINYTDFHTWRQNAHAFEAMALFDGGEFNVSDGSEAFRLEGAAVTHDFDDVLGIQPLLGRTFTAEEDAPGGERVVVLGHGLWRTRFASDPAVLGRTLHISGDPHTIIGVLPPEAEFPGNVEFWIPLRGDPAQHWQGYSFDGIGRLKAGFDLGAAQQDLERAHAPIWEERDEDRVVSPVMLPLRDYFVGDYRPMSVALLGGVAVVLLIACANVASLMLARALARRREMGIRMAMGAGTMRLVRQLFTENLVLALLGGAAGLGLGYVGARVLVSRLPDQLPGWATFSIDARVVLFSLLATVATAILFGWAPAWIAARSDVRGALHETSGRATASPGARRTLGALISMEVALAVVLLVGGGLLLRAYDRLAQVDPGFDTENVLTFGISLPPSGYPDSTSQLQFWNGLIERIEALPGVDAAGAISCLPLTCHWGNFFEVEGAPPRAPDQPDPVVLTRIATPGYFDAMDIRLVAGRFYDEAEDRPGAPPVVVVNQSFAKQFWPAVANPVGRRLRFRGWDDSQWVTVVAVASDVRHYGLDTPMRPGLYFPMNARTGQLQRLSVAVRAAGSETSLVAPVRSIVRDLDPTIPLAAVGTTEDALRRSLLLRQTYSWALAIFAGLALALAIGGIYGVTSYIVTQRTREIGIRLALGARTSAVVGSIVRRGMVAVTGGLLLGLAAAFAAARALAGLLFGVQPGDPAVYATVAGLLLLTALAAHGLPARRAARTDPMHSLRTD